jgi:hypothetical protein
MTRQLTEMQQRFLDVLFEEAQGDALAAKKLAGYSDTVATSQVLASLEKEVEELTRKHLTRASLKAAYVLGDVLANPTQLGVKERLNAAKDTLDRTGFVKTQQVEVKTETPLFILPAKQEEDEDGA